MKLDDVELLDWQKRDIESYQKIGYKNVEETSHVYRIQAYLERYFRCESERIKLGNCWYRGRDVYSKKDYQPFDEEDISVLKELKGGQWSTLIGHVGDIQVVCEWECDSGD